MLCLTCKLIFRNFQSLVREYNERRAQNPGTYSLPPPEDLVTDRIEHKEKLGIDRYWPWHAGVPGFDEYRIYKNNIRRHNVNTVDSDSDE